MIFDYGTSCVSIKSSNEQQREKTKKKKKKKMTCAPSEDSDQRVPLPSLIRVFTVRMKKA